MKTVVWIVFVACAFMGLVPFCFGESEGIADDLLEKEEKDVRKESLKREVKECLDRLGNSSFKVRRAASRRLLEIARSGPLPEPPKETAAKKTSPTTSKTDEKKPSEEHVASKPMVVVIDGEEVGDASGDEVVEEVIVEDVDVDTDDDMEVEQVEVLEVVAMPAAVGGQVKRPKRRSKDGIDDTVRSTFPYLEMVLQETSRRVHHSDPEVASRAREVCEACGRLILESKEAYVDERW